MTAITPEVYDRLNPLLGNLRLPYCPHEPTAKQEFFLIQDALECFFGGAAGPGKVIPLDELLPTPSGWTTVGAVRPGDMLFTELGEPTVVLAVSEIDPAPESYRLTFDDGSTIDAGADHLWTTFDAKQLAQLTRRNPEWRMRRRASRPSRATHSQGEAKALAVAERNAAYPPPMLDPPAGSVRTTLEIARTLTTESGRRNHAISVAAPLDLPDRDLPLDPYLLGVWLGDGTTNGGAITTADQEVLGAFETAGFTTKHYQRYTHGVRGLRTVLRQIGVFGCKHIPAQYQRASIRQRRALLEGLMDSDGHASRTGDVEFTNTNERLARDVYELATGLGQKVRLAEGRATLYGKDCGPKWRLNWAATFPVFRLQHKLECQRLSSRRTTRFRYIVTCDPIPSVPMRCLRVGNPTSLFLVGRAMIPTHNSWGLLMGALQYVDRPGYHALLLRPSLTEFEMQGGLIEVSEDWLSHDHTVTRPSWNGSDRQWTFNGGASIKFGYLANIGDLSRYKGGGVSFIGFDELTSFTERLYRAMFRLLRRAEDALPGVPLRMRSASNPGDIGHAWVKARFVDPRTRRDGAVYIPAKMSDNPHLNMAEYLLSLAEMHPVDRQRLIDGDWDVAEEGSKFKRHKFRIIPESMVAPPIRRVRYWDLAGTVPSVSNASPDFTVGLLYEVDAQGFFTIRDVTRGQWGDDDVETTVRHTAMEDGRGVDVYIEQDPGQAGKAQLNNYKRRVLQGFACHAGSTRINGVNAAKEVRARPVAAAVGNDLVRIVEGCKNTREFLDVVSIFPNGEHDDDVDALSGAHNALTARPIGSGRVSRPKGRVPGTDMPR